MSAIDRLPPELLRNIVAKLSGLELACAMPTSRAFQAAGSDPAIWAGKLAQEYDIRLEPELLASARLIYVTLHQLCRKKCQSSAAAQRPAVANFPRLEDVDRLFENSNAASTFGWIISEHQAVDRNRRGNPGYTALLLTRGATPLAEPKKLTLPRLAAKSWLNSKEVGERPSITAWNALGRLIITGDNAGGIQIWDPRDYYNSLAPVFRKNLKAGRVEKVALQVTRNGLSCFARTGPGACIRLDLSPHKN